MWSALFATVMRISASHLHVSETTMSITTTGISTASWTAALALFYKCKRLLVVAPLYVHPNPVKNIVCVVWFAWKHKYPIQPSALMYWEYDYPSRIDLGKLKYGGPFTVEEVEDVNTVLRLVLLIVVVSLIIGMPMLEKIGT